jgi:hypothetical protein
MTNNEFKKELDYLLKSYGFKKKGNKWTSETDELEKIIYLQKSNFNNSYYINYGYNFKDLDYTEVNMHVWSRLGSSNRKENALIIKTLDLENSLIPAERKNHLKYFINTIILTEMGNIDSKKDILNSLKTLKNLNTLFLRVKQHLNLV